CCAHAHSHRRTSPSVIASARGAARHAGVAQRRKRAADDRVRFGNKRSSEREIVAAEKASETGQCGQSGLRERAYCAGHCWPPITAPGGTSSISCKAFRSTFLAPSGAANAKASAVGGTSVFQS